MRKCDLRESSARFSAGFLPIQNLLYDTLQYALFNNKTDKKVNNDGLYEELLLSSRVCDKQK